MLKEYFAIHIDAEANLVALPSIFNGHLPQLERIPDFIVTLASEVDWDSEKECFQACARVIGEFYAADMGSGFTHDCPWLQEVIRGVSMTTTATTIL